MSWVLDVSGTMERICPGSQGLEEDDNDDNDNDDNDNDDNDNNDDDNNDKDEGFSYPCHTVSPPTQHKSWQDLGEPNLFFLNSRHSYMVKDRIKSKIYAKKLAKHALKPEEEAQEFQEPFHKDMEMSGNLLKNEDLSWTYQLPVHQRPHDLPPDSMVPRGSYDSFQCSMGKHLGTDDFGPLSHASELYQGYLEHTRGAEPHMLPEEATGDRELPTLQPPYEVLREENAMLKRVVRSMRNSLESQMCTVQRLERQLKASQAKQEKKKQELQSFVQQTEWSLQQMTWRAQEAESNMEKMKQEIFVLQGKLETSKAENENLRAGQTTDLGAVKHNIDIALQNLYKIIMGANLSIKQLSSGAELLCFVAEVLKSAGNISEVKGEKEL